MFSTMKIQRIFLIGSLLSYLTFPTFSQDNAINSINENDLKVHLSFIASNQLKGRKLGSIELEMAKEYIVSNLVKTKIEPVNIYNSYLQSINFMRVEPDSENTFINIINNELKESKVTHDSMLCLFPHPKDFFYNGSVIFIGYGITDSINGYDDYANIDVRGKVVMMLSRSIGLVEGENANNPEPFNYELEYEKITNAYNHGAKAVLWIQDPMNKFKNISDLKELNEYAIQQIYTEGNPKTVLPIDFIILTQHTADSILNTSGNYLVDLQNKINTNKKPSSFELDKTNIAIQINRKIEDFKSSNIIGYIEGCDPILKNEYIIYTAHYDHLGVDENGNIYNGADDNGSGTVALLELAEAFMTLQVKPKRSIVFAWMTAEEKGGAGSNYYVEHPLFPLKNTVTCINIDMIGRVKTAQPENKRWIDVKSADSLFVITDRRSAELIDINNEACNNLKLYPDYSDKQNRLEFSDQYFFYKKGIPVLFYHTGFHEDTHTIADKFEKIDFVKMKRVTQLAFLVGYNIANNAKLPQIDFSK